MLPTIEGISDGAQVASLRDYQWEGVNFLLCRKSALLADEMGLGKTVQVSVALSLTGALTVHAYDLPEVVAGQGTLGREFDGQAPALDTVLVAVRGGGLIGGVAAWFGDRARVVAVEPERAPTLFRAVEAGEPVDVEVGGVAADSLGASRLGEVSFGIVREYVDRAVLVGDGDIENARRVLWRDLRVAAEPGGATALASLLSGEYVPEKGERVGVVICGANADPGELSDRRA